MAKYDADQLRQMAKNGQAMPDGSYPIGDAEDLQNAIHAVGRGGADHDTIRKHIIKRAGALGKSEMIPDSWGSDGSLGDDSSRADATPYTRSFALEDISIRAGGDGRTVDAYAAIFNMPSPISDQDGQYEEVIDPACFNRAIEHAGRSGQWRVPVMFNHGMTLYGTPSPDGTMPIGTPLEIRADQRGLFTRTRYNNTPLAEHALECIREGSITAYSFQGAFRRSDPVVRRGQRLRPDARGNLPTVRRMESTLKEFGPTPFPAYQEAAIVGVRAEQVAEMLAAMNAEQRDRLIEVLRSEPTGDVADLGTPDEGLAADDPPELGHSHRSLNSQHMRERYARFLARRQP